MYRSIIFLRRSSSVAVLLRYISSYRIILINTRAHILSLIVVIIYPIGEKKKHHCNYYCFLFISTSADNNTTDSGNSTGTEVAPCMDTLNGVEIDPANFYITYILLLLSRKLCTKTPKDLLTHWTCTILGAVLLMSTRATKHLRNWGLCFSFFMWINLFCLEVPQ